MPNGSMRSLKGKTLCSLIINQFANAKLHCFHGNPIMRFLNTGSVPTKIFISKQQYILEQ